MDLLTMLGNLQGSSVNLQHKDKSQLLPVKFQEGLDLTNDLGVWRTKLPPNVKWFDASESINHLFLYCPFAADTWCMFITLFGLHCSMTYSIRDAFVNWCTWKVGKSFKRIWSLIPACILWCIWTERNQRCFDGISMVDHALKIKCLVNLFSWVNFTPAKSEGKLRIILIIAASWCQKEDSDFICSHEESIGVAHGI
ncbi:hypothetical protein H5410_036610 [Solanum commersonii]|uniref:Reverse transcriptase zinc-binding domain-containing protein n=1 Tax=Solanum commersonii TaxID=4109 RepID=A0A9J5Y5S7_SOLCO|nr:hypothetical protein H5410_036610 [Solanum commersonii]